MQKIGEILKKYWGFDQFFPLQQQAVEAALVGQDSLVVLPTGGGKSVCYQLPPLLMPNFTLVVSPLKSLMKDQVDGLRELGISAAALSSSQAASEKREAIRMAEAGQLKLLYIAPERLLLPNTIEWLKSCPPASIAIDEAHCISHWGHDFRPEYRDLGVLREALPGLAIHAFTATATERVRQDIVQQLKMRDPLQLVGNFFRSNLVYHVRRRESGWNQICEVMDRHRGQAGIIYAISRTKAEQISETLNQLGYRTLPYHAGLTDAVRSQHQEAFIHDQIEAIVATVAFGMGIDKSNVRYVIHAEMPKSIEAYQQESGRAGRDGLEAECWLLHSPADLIAWERMLEGSSSQPPEFQRQQIQQVQSFATSIGCRHAHLVAYFGQSLTPPCNACDICLGRIELTDQPLRIGQIILSCVHRCQQRFGGAHIGLVLAGSRDAKIVKSKHDQLSTYGLLKDKPRKQIRDWIDQLIQQQFLAVTQGAYPVLTITDIGRQLLRGERVPVLHDTVTAERMVTDRNLLDSWEGVDRPLFEQLRQLRRSWAMEVNSPPFILFSDATLRDLARIRPIDQTHLLAVHGIGQQKSEKWGCKLLPAIRDWCQVHRLTTNFVPNKVSNKNASSGGKDRNKLTSTALAAFPLIEQGLAVETICERLTRARSTVLDYLAQYIAHKNVADASRWIDPLVIGQVEQILGYVGTERLRPIYDALHGKVPYEEIRIVVACFHNKNRGGVRANG